MKRTGCDTSATFLDDGGASEVPFSGKGCYCEAEICSGERGCVEGAPVAELKIALSSSDSQSTQQLGKLRREIVDMQSIVASSSLQADAMEMKYADAQAGHQA